MPPRSIAIALDPQQQEGLRSYRKIGLRLNINEFHTFCGLVNKVEESCVAKCPELAGYFRDHPDRVIAILLRDRLDELGETSAKPEELDHLINNLQADARLVEKDLSYSRGL